MVIDRLLIACSVVELTHLGYYNGVAGYTPFQWIALVLLSAKLVLVLRSWCARRPLT